MLLNHQNIIRDLALTDDKIMGLSVYVLVFCFKIVIYFIIIYIYGETIVRDTKKCQYFHRKRSI